MFNFKDFEFNKILLIFFFISINTSFISSSQASSNKFENIENFTNLDSSYLESKDQLKDYILDSGDVIEINFINAPELNGQFLIDENGEIFLPKIKQAYISGLTLNEANRLIEEKYKDFLISPELFLRIIKYKPIRISINGEVTSPGVYIFKPLKDSIIDKEERAFESIDSNMQNDISIAKSNLKSNSILTKISDVIRKAGGLTSYSDLTRITLIRDNPISSGGGKKKAVIDFYSYLEGSTATDVRLFNGDYIMIPKLQSPNPSIIPLSILSKLTPSFISVTISGKITTPGKITLPHEGTLSDALNISGPKKPLSGKIVIFRYKKDGTLERKNINYNAKAINGSPRNPYLINGDMISVKDSLFGKSTGVIKSLTDPFIGVYTTKELLESF